MSEPILLLNGIRTPDGTDLYSRYTHDYVTHTDHVTGNKYMVDGGLEYGRRSAWGDEIDLSIRSDDEFEVIRRAPLWGTRGINGNEPLRYVSIAAMDTNHIETLINEYLPDQFRSGRGTQWLEVFNDLLLREQIQRQEMRRFHDETP